MKTYKCYKTVGAKKYIETIQELNDKVAELERHGHWVLNTKLENGKWIVSYNHKEDLQ